MRRSNAPTLKDVANEAGVTVMAASVVLNGASSSARVSAKTRARIMEVAARLRYRRNAVALGLSRRRMETIGVVSTMDCHDTNVYFLEVLNGILAAAADRGQSTTIFSVSDWHEDEARILEFCDGRIDGIVLIGPHLAIPFAQTLAHYTPFVTIHSNGSVPHAYNIDVDDEGGAYAITRYLITQGHRRILHFTGWLDMFAAQQRLAGYRRALEEEGLPYEDALVIPGYFTIGSGHDRMIDVLRQRAFSPLPTAVFCASDAIAYGCMEALAKCGLRVPCDISVVGFDDTLLARMTNPLLTTVRQPFRQMGRRAVELLLSQIQGEAAAATKDGAPPAFAGSTVSGSHAVIFAVEPVAREFVGPPPEQPILPASIGRR